MKPIEMQQKVLDSESRITVITAQPGAGSTTAVLLKVYAEAKKHETKFGVFYVVSDSHLPYCVETLKKMFKGGRWSPDSKIYTTKDRVKIKISQWFDITHKFIPVVGFDLNRHNETLEEALISAGKIVLAERVSALIEEGSWARKYGLLFEDVRGFYSFRSNVTHIKGYTKDNPHLPNEYIKHLNKSATNGKLNELMDISLRIKRD